MTYARYDEKVHCAYMTGWQHADQVITRYERALARRIVARDKAIDRRKAHRAEFFRERRRSHMRAFEAKWRNRDTYEIEERRWFEHSAHHLLEQTSIVPYEPEPTHRFGKGSR